MHAPRPLVLRGRACSGSEAGSYLRLIDSCITQIKAQGPSRSCNKSTEEEEEAQSSSRSPTSSCRPSSTPVIKRSAPGVLNVQRFVPQRFKKRTAHVLNVLNVYCDREGTID